MSLVIDQAWAVASALLWIRLGVLFFMTPLLAGFNGPPALLALLSLVLSGLICTGQPVDAAASHGVGAFVWAGVLEVGIGLLLAFGVHTAFAALSMAGELLDLQIGFGAANVFNPTTRTDSPLIGAILSSLGVVVFFALDGHHAFMRGIAFSVVQMPPGEEGAHLSMSAVVRQFGAIFTLALALAAPVLSILALAEVGFAVVSRVLPQMNVYFVALPLKILAGLAALAFASTALAPVMGRAFAGIFHYWDEVLR
jgi:flagellar biosynthetic protein FliR